MYLFQLTRQCHGGYDTYSAAVVCAESEADAATIHPDGEQHADGENTYGYDSWVPASEVRVRLLGVALDSLPRGVVCASYHAG